ncbi:MAG: tRNA lysidine(34) synthetase TilS [Spirochaetaceae bacterium]|jgi:tRNA(Ile)-lysidine synthase|nr:tRNA lysidine(34) synthetase TilS [Spirochaetaceae bacterium]
MNAFEEAVARELGTVVRKGFRLLAAVSGGADSTAMLAALSALQENLGFDLFCLHVDHGIRSREESRGDARWVKKLCAFLEIPCRVVSIPPGRVAEAARRRGIGLEGAARLYRHAAWNREARRIGADRILTAHTRNDLRETILMRFLRGAGPAGLAGIPRSRSRLFRPLLDQDRSAVLRYLEDRNLSYRTDSTNADNGFLRNRIRNKLIPILDELFPFWQRSLPVFGETQGLAAAFITASARCGLPWESAGHRALALPREDFFAAPEIIREEALFLAADRLKAGEGGAGFNPDRVRPRGAREPRREVIRLFARGGISALDAGPLRIEDRGDRIFALSPGGEYEAGFSRLIKEPGRYKLKGFVIETAGPGEGKKGFFALLPLVVRRNFHDDVIIVKGRKRSVKKALARMPRSEYTDIINIGDAEGTAAVIGLDRKGPVILLRREREAGAEGPPFFFFSLAGGTDV